MYLHSISQFILYSDNYPSYELKVCSPQQNSYVETLPPNEMVWGGGAFGRGLELDEVMRVEPSWMGLVPSKESQKSLLPLSASAMWEHSKKTAIYEPGSRPSLDTRSAGTLILDFPASRTVRNKYLFFKPPSVWYFTYSSPKRLRQCPFHIYGKWN